MKMVAIEGFLRCVLYWSRDGGVTVKSMERAASNLIAQGIERDLLRLIREAYALVSKYREQHTT